MTIKEAYKILFEDTNEYSEIEILSRLNEDSIKRNYRELSKKYHPDYNKNNLEFANQKQQQINEAHDILKESLKRYLETIEKTQYEIFVKKYRRSIIIKEYDFFKQNLNKINYRYDNNIFGLLERFNLLEQYIEILEEKESSSLNLDKSIYTKEYLEKLSQENAREFYPYLFDEEKFHEKTEWLNSNKNEINKIIKEINNLNSPNEILYTHFKIYLDQMPEQYINYFIYTNNKELINLYQIIQTNALSDDEKINCIKSYLSTINDLQKNYKELNESIDPIKKDIEKNKNITYEVINNYFNQINKYFDEEYLLKLKNNQIENAKIIQEENKKIKNAIEETIKNTLKPNLENHIEEIFEKNKEITPEEIDKLFEAFEKGEELENQVLTIEDEEKYKEIKKYNENIFNEIVTLHIFYEEIVGRIKEKNDQNLINKLIINNPSEYMSNEKMKHESEEKELIKVLKKELDVYLEKLIICYLKELKIDSEEFRKIYQMYAHGKNTKISEDITKILIYFKEKYAKFQNKDNIEINQQNLLKYKKGLVSKISKTYENITLMIETNQALISDKSNNFISKVKEILENQEEIDKEMSLIDLCNIYEMIYDIYFYEINDYKKETLFDHENTINQGLKNSR